MGKRTVISPPSASPQKYGYLNGTLGRSEGKEDLNSSGVSLTDTPSLTDIQGTYRTDRRFTLTLAMEVLRHSTVYIFTTQ